MNEVVKSKILEEAETLFLKYGFKSITMDDVSRELGISKKTLYQHFTDKQDLVDQCVENHLARISDVCNNAMAEREDAIDVLLYITHFTSTLLKQVSQSSMYDLKKYFKSAWDKLENNRKEFIYASIRQNLENGIKKGLYRKEIKVEAVARIYVHLVGYLIDPDHQHSDIDIRDMHMEIIRYHFHAVCTPKGLEILNERIKAYHKK